MLPFETLTLTQPVLPPFTYTLNESFKYVRHIPLELPVELDTIKLLQSGIVVLVEEVVVEVVDEVVVDVVVEVEVVVFVVEVVEVVVVDVLSSPCAGPEHEPPPLPAATIIFRIIFLLTLIVPSGVRGHTAV